MPLALACNIAIALFPTTRGHNAKRIILNLLGHKIGPGTKVNGAVKFYGRGVLATGKDCWIGIGCTFFLTPEASITIGDNCDIAPHVHFITGTHDMGGPERRAGACKSLPIVIGPGTWVGTRVTLLPGTVLGRGSMVAAGAVVPGRSHPDHALLAGVPAVVKKSLEPEV